MTVSAFDEQCLRRVGVIAAVVLAAVLLLPQLAHAHATGIPPHATVAADGNIVTLDWVAADDDAAAVGVAIGLLPAEVVDAYLGWGPVEDLPSAAEVHALSRSEELSDYLLDNVAVTQAGQPCAGHVRPAEDFINDGARFTFTCADPVDYVDVRITILHDKDPLYRTFGVDGSYQTTVHTASRPEHTWDFTGASALPPGVAARSTAGREAALGGGGAALALTVLALWWRRRRRLGDARAPEPRHRAKVGA